MNPQPDDYMQKKVAALSAASTKEEVLAVLERIYIDGFEDGHDDVEAHP